MVLKRIRRQRKMTQAQLAELVGVHRIYIAQIEAGTKVPSLPTLEKIAAKLRVKLGRLLE